MATSLFLLSIGLASLVRAAEETPAPGKKVDIGNFETDKQLSQRLDFVERNTLAILQYGHFPQIYNSSYEKIASCGCEFSPKKIHYGTRVGLQCNIRIAREGGPPIPYDEENCGIRCSDPHGFNVVQFCPYGWIDDCTTGCTPPREFENVAERINFWELILTSLMMYGHDYVEVAQDFLEECGCDGKIQPIRFGTQIGYVCALQNGRLPRERCRAHTDCKDQNGRIILTFCPSGFYPTCSGCEKALEDDDFKSRLNWMIDVVTGYGVESHELLGWQPTVNQVLGCACVDGIHRIPYGKNLGFYCVVRDSMDIKKSCGPNVLCKNQDGKDLLHFCPTGFVPSCQEGCSYPWYKEDLKKEL